MPVDFFRASVLCLFLDMNICMLVLLFLCLVCTTSASDRTEANNGASCAFYIPGILGTRQILSRFYDGSRHFSLLKRRENRFQWPFYGRMETSFPNYSSLDENTPPLPEEEKG